MGVLDQLLLAKAPETGVIVIVLGSGKILDDRVGFGQQRDLYLPAAGSAAGLARRMSSTLSSPRADSFWRA